MNTPSYQPFQVQNNSTQGGMMSANASAMSFGGGEAENDAAIAKGLGDAANVGSAIQADQQRQINNDKVRMALSDYSDKMDEKVSGDFLQRKGASAINMMPDAKQFHNDLRQEKLDSLDNDYQRRVFAEMEADHRRSSLKTVAAHQAKQQQIFHQHSLLADSATALNNAVISQNDPQELARHELTIRQNTLHLYEDDPEADVKADAAVSHMYETIAKTKAQTETATKALAFLEEHKDKFQEVPRDALQAKFEDKAIAEAANVKSQIIATTPGMDEGKAQKIIDETIKNPKEATLTMAQVKSRLAVNEKMTKDATQAQTEGAWKSFIKDPTQDIDTNLPHEEQIKMAEYRDKSVKQVTEEQKQNLYGKLLNLPDAEFMDYNLNTHAVELGDHFNFLLKRQEAMRKGDKGEGSEFNIALNKAKEAASKLPIFNVTEKDTQDSATKKESQLHAYLADFSKAYDQETQGGKKIQWDTIGKIQDRLLNQNVLKQTHWFSKPDFSYKGGNVAPLNIQPNALAPVTQASQVQSQPAPTTQAPTTQTATPQAPGQAASVTEDQPPVNPNTFVNPPSTSDQLLRAKLGVSSGLPIPTWHDLKESASQVVADLKTSGNAVASLPGKAWSAIADPVGGAIGAAYDHVRPTEPEMKYANDLHVLLSNSGIDTKEADEAFKSMNGVNISNPKTGEIYPQKSSIFSGRNYIEEVNKIANQHANEIAKQLNLQRVRNIQEMSGIQSKEMFLYNGKILIKK